MGIEEEVTNSLLKLRSVGQSPWCDSISRSLINELPQRIAKDGLCGITSNPTIFEKAINGSLDYDKEIQSLAQAGMSTFGIYESLVVHDIQKTADQFGKLFEKSNKIDGFVSLEVSPHLAHNTQKTIEEGRHLWRLVARPNLMIKVPATPAGIPAVTQLISEGINVNVTLMFSINHYRQVAKAYMRGLESLDRTASFLPVASVASFFVSRVDTVVDKLLCQLKEQASTEIVKNTCEDLFGKAAIANTRLVYQEFKKIFSEKSFLNFKEKGFNVQRPLWASTSTKNPNYRDVLYVEELIGENTINTMPLDTMAAFRSHGRVTSTLENGLEDAIRTLSLLKDLGIDLDAVTLKLQEDGVKLFLNSFDNLISSIAKKRKKITRI
ncbi:MAG: transaldolase [Acidobacteriia bacterium]|nr:transaldolase [Terriglobia bacterium]